MHRVLSVSKKSLETRVLKNPFHFCLFKVGGVTLSRPSRKYSTLMRLDPKYASSTKTTNLREVSLKCVRRLMRQAIEFPRLTPQQVTSLLGINEQCIEINEGAVTYYDRNQLHSNNPIEDRRAEAKAQNGNRFFFGVFDGHAGCACAQAVSERLFNYIAISLAEPTVLDKIQRCEIDLQNELLHWYRHRYDYINQDLEDQLKKSTGKLAEEMLSMYEADVSIEDCLTTAFLRLDQDISLDALSIRSGADVFAESLEVAFSGSCACVLFIDDLDLYLANVGDSKAVLGVNSSGDTFEAVELSTSHSAENESEIKRLFNSHPNESFNIIKNGRLLGDLAPLRAFGDVRYKWSKKDLAYIANKINSPDVSFVNIYGKNIIPKNYSTPPYLTAQPEITKYKLSPKDKFIVIASDGLWDMLPPEKVVNLVAGHMQGKQVLGHFQPIHDKMTLSDINISLQQRKIGLANKPIDANASTHLIRNALGAEHGHLSAMLSLPSDIVRYYRDDMTVLVIYFNTDYVMNTFCMN